MSTILLALNHDCPFCGAVAGSPCRTRTKAGRPGGREQSWPHSRRIALTTPAQDRSQSAPVRVKALCCVCGTVRRVNSDYSRYNDPNHSDRYFHYSRGQNQGWRATETLKCDTCEEKTRHAVLNREDRPELQNTDEVIQLIALGGTSENWSESHIADLRRQYREMPIPRNPNLKHRFYIEPATKAWDAGQREVIALCGELGTISTDPRTWGPSAKKQKRREELYDGFNVAEQLGDTEYEDAATGLYWVDMDCVDCCRVSNDLRRKKDRDRLELLLAYLASRPEIVPDTAVGDLLQTLDEWYEKSKGEVS